MKARLLLNIALAAAVIVLTLAVWLDPAPKASAYPLSSLKAETVRQIRIDKPGQAAVALEKTAAGWRLAAPFAARADALRPERLLALLSATSPERFAATDLARFELDKPLLTLTLGKQRFAFGALNPLSQQQYVATDGYVFLIDPQIASDAYVKAADFAAKSLLAANEQPIGFDLPERKLERNGNGKWSATPPLPDANQDALNRFADEWRNASALLVQPYDGSPPLHRLRLQLADGRRLNLAVIQERPDFVLLREDEKLQYHFLPEMASRLLQPK
ncbi:MAG: DUF4340 domain-containing protein [Sulfuricellaceae bacterium]|jgi:hypothetical protein